MRPLFSVILWLLAALASLVFKFKNSKTPDSIQLAKYAEEACIGRKRVVTADARAPPFYLARNIGVVWCGAKGAASKQWQEVLEELNEAPLEYLWNSPNAPQLLANSKKLLTIRSPQSRLASAWMESPLSPPGQDGDDFASLLRFIVQQRKMHRLLHSRLADISSTCQVCQYSFDFIWKEEAGLVEANGIINSISGVRSKVPHFPFKEIAASNSTTEKLLSQLSPKLISSITELYKNDLELFNY